MVATLAAGISGADSQALPQLVCAAAARFVNAADQLPLRDGANLGEPAGAMNLSERALHRHLTERVNESPRMSSSEGMTVLLK